MTTALQSEIKTALKDIEKEIKENQGRHENYKGRHDKLELQEIE